MESEARTASPRRRKLKNQGDHGKCRANYRCCIPALAGFVSPHSVGPGGAYDTCKAVARKLKDSAPFREHAQNLLLSRSRFFHFQKLPRVTQSALIRNFVSFQCKAALRLFHAKPSYN